MKSENARRIATLPSGAPLCDAIAAILPQDRKRDAEFCCEHGRFSASLMVRRGVSREACQDTAVFASAGGLALMAVFDGYGDSGDFYSGFVASAAMDAFLANPAQFSSPAGPSLLIREASSLLVSLGFNGNGGTTATVAIIRQDGSFSIAGIGDSAAYLAGRNEAMRMLDYSLVMDPAAAARGVVSEVHVAQLGMSPVEYAETRNVLARSISWKGVDEAQSEHGGLPPASRLVLASDGITKNLFFGTDSCMNVNEVSGNADMAALLASSPALRRAGAITIREIRRRTGNPPDAVPLGNGFKVLMPADDDMTLALLALKE